MASPALTVFPAAGEPPRLLTRPSLAPQQLGLAAVDAGHCCPERTQLHLHVENPNVQQDAVRVDDNATGLPAFFITRRSMSLHRHRLVLHPSGDCVATLRTARVWKRRALQTTYRVFLGEDTSKKTGKLAFEFVVRRGWALDMEFHDLMTDTTCHLGTDGGRNDLEIWVKRGGKGTDRHPIAHMHAGLPGSPPGHTIEVAEGVDVLLVLLVCLALKESAAEI